MSQTTIIQEQNDRFRAGDEEILGSILITANLAGHLAEIGQTDGTALCKFVAEYSDFTPDNDPYQQHDFGSFNWHGEKCFWKIDLFDPSMTAYPTDPSDLTQTRRVLTIMLASDY